MARRTGLMLILGGAIVALGVVMYVVGFHAGSQAAAAHAALNPSSASGSGIGPVAAATVQSPPPLQEFIPLPMPGQGRDDQPGRGNQQGQDCEPVILFYYQGRLYQLRPGQGPQGQRGVPGSPPEYFPLTPYQGPAIPGLPGIPFGPQPGPGAPTPIPGNPPNFQPQNPRF